MHHSSRCPKQPAELSCIASIHLTIRLEATGIFQRFKMVQKIWGLGFPMGLGIYGFLAFALLFVTILIPLCHRVSQLDPRASGGAAEKARQGHRPVEQISNREIKEFNAVWGVWNLAERIMLFNIWIYFITFRFFVKLEGMPRFMVHARLEFHMSSVKNLQARKLIGD